MAKRPTIFKWRQTEPALILCAVRWYLRYSLSLRDVEELLEERGLEADHTTVWRWVQRYAPELEQRLRRYLKSTNKSWRVDETYVRVKGRWCYLYRAIDSTGATIDFLLSALRDADAAKRLFRNALSDRSHPQPRVINTDLAPIYSSAIPDIKKDGVLRSRWAKALHSPSFYPFWDKRIERRPWLDLWKTAYQRLANVEAVIIWGYSLPPTDINAQHFFSLALGDKPFTLCVVDPSEASRRRWRELLPHALYFPYTSVFSLHFRRALL